MFLINEDIHRWKCLIPAEPALIKWDAVMEKRSFTSFLTE